MHVLGYRPNLTRLSDEARFYTDQNEEKCYYYPIEAIAIEVAKSTLPPAGTSDTLFSLNFFHHITTVSCPNTLAYTLLIAFAFGRDCRRLIHDTLKLYQENRHQQWDNEWSQMCTTVSRSHLFIHHSSLYQVANILYLLFQVFKVLVAIPDEWQKDRISMLMTSDHKEAFGLLRAGEMCANTRDNHHYAEKILDLMKTLKKYRAVSEWMVENPVFQEWMEPQPRRMHQLQSRNDHSGRRDGHHNMHAGHSDSEGLHDSDDIDSDEDSAFMNVIKEMTVEGAGLREINGTYRRCGGHDNVSKYVRPSRYNGRSVDFMLFRCKLTDGTRRWYISIVPENTHPGTTQDIDFYAASLSPGAGVDHSIPPRDGWIAIPSNGGGSPAPTVYPKESNIVGENETGYL